MELVVTEGPDRGRRLAVGAAAQSIGRNADNDLALADTLVSGRHAVVRALDGAHVQITDVASTNGTWVGGSRIDGSHVVAAGAEFVVGRDRLVVQPTLSGHQSGPVDGYPRSPAPSGDADHGYVPSASNAGPVAGGNVAMDGYAVAGRDLNYHEGFRIRTRMRRGAKRVLYWGIALIAIGMLAGIGAIVGMMIRTSQLGYDPFSEQADQDELLFFGVFGAALVLSVLGTILIIVSLLMRREQVREIVPVRP